LLTWEDDLEVHAVRKRGWSISAIARHTGNDCRTDGPHVFGRRRPKPGVRAWLSPDPFDPFVAYVTARLGEDAHLWAPGIVRRVGGSGVRPSYQSLTRNIRVRDLRPTCEACRRAHQCPNADIAHPPGDETRWDGLELPNPHEAWV
jgi:hypothetical protein